MESLLLLAVSLIVLGTRQYKQQWTDRPIIMVIGHLVIIFIIDGMRF